jgi:ribosome-associated toxin RatA of RatAB toxin-antitoxin module
MANVVKSVLVARPAAEMFALVDDCERYQEFLPWCSGAQVSERTPELTRARLDIDYHGLKSHISTVNRKHPPDRIDIEFLEGPFDFFHGHWRFTSLGEAGCRVEFEVEYQLASDSLAAVLRPVFGHIVETLVDRFVTRAESD